MRQQVNQTETQTRKESASTEKQSFTQSAPNLTLPKGGGAIRGMGEKFAANPVTGTGSMSVPIATSPGRSGFGPQLSLSYDSGAGNGPFGFGWSLSLPSITRKTDKGLPQYFDTPRDSDVFILSGAEDLVPVYRQDASGSWERDAQGNLLIHEDEIDGYRVRRYQPRIEGLFARIERWILVANPHDVHWRSISKDNILTLYGRDVGSRIVDPEDPGRIFSWLICETRDDKGNAVLYRYKAEDGINVDLGRVSERNRGAREDVRRTANCYLKRIYYGNRTPLLDDAGHRPRFLDHAQIDEQIANAGWMFEVVFDYGEHDPDTPKPHDSGAWTYRLDPFSSYRSGFEIRTTRLCQRVLMFHHFPEEEGVGENCLVRTTDFTYSHEQDPNHARNPVYTFLQQLTQSGYRREGDTYLRRSLPPVEFEYAQPIVQDMVEEVDPASLENLPIGVDGTAYQWIDLHGEGIPGILTEQGNAWHYKRNISPIGSHEVEFAPLEQVSIKPSQGLAVGAQFMDLAGDGLPDLVMFDNATPGLYEHDTQEGWQSFRPFTARINHDLRDANLKFVDLDGDGHTDILITEDNAFVWHTSLAEAGFGPAERVAQALDEEKGPRLVFADNTQSIYLADLSGDGLTDLVRIRNGEVCYWPNLGYGRFGAKINMDHAPWFDNPDQFEHRCIRLADIDGSGTTDIIYLHRDGVQLYFNQSGNSWSEPNPLRVFPRIDDLVSIQPTDLLGNGTACLVWSSPLPGDRNRPMRYVNLMGGQKPHLLIRTLNNLGAETHVRYAPSIKFYLQDKRDGRPWVTRLPFPVHVVERVDTYDRISRNRFVTRYSYHHGYFDGEEREFRGFGMVEQWDTEEFAALSDSDAFPVGDNVDASSHVPPVHTKTWFHTGIYLGRTHVSDFFAGLLDGRDLGEYYREPDLTDAQARSLLLDDTILPPGMTVEEEREACRALKGAMLRQEVYADDGTSRQPHPYIVSEQNFTIRLVQPQADNRHAVFFTHAREVLSYHYERNPVDPRVSHAMTLEVDNFGNVLQSAAVGYGRRQADPSPVLQEQDRARQTQHLITYTESQVTNALEASDDYRTPLPYETQTFELTNVALLNGHVRYALDDLINAYSGAVTISYEEAPTLGLVQRRLIEHIHMLYRPNDLGASQNNPLALLPPGNVESLALPGESYKLAFTPSLIMHVYGERVTDAMLEEEGRYVHSEGDSNWWIPAGRVFYSSGPEDAPDQELAFARQHFFLPHRFRDPFHTASVSTESFISYDQYDLLMLETRDALGNRVTVGERDENDNLVAAANDYRVLQPRLMMDPNRNRAAVAFDALGMVVATAVMGKPPPEVAEGDSLADFEPDITDEMMLAHFNDPFADSHALLQGATTRLIYDLFAYQRTRNDPHPQPAIVYTMARETHVSDLAVNEQSRIQHSFSYSDGFGREIQKKIQAEPGPVLMRDADGAIILDENNQPQMTPDVVPIRWVGSGWTLFNNKGKPVRQYEPLFTHTHRFEFDVRVGVSPVLFYDPVERVVATLHPNHSWEKVIFDPWRQESWDVNDTVLIADPATDPDVGAYFSRLVTEEYLPTWHTQRVDGALGLREQAAAIKTEAHAATPAIAYFDALGRPFLTVADNGPDPAQPNQHLLFATRTELDIEGNQRAVRDAIVQAGDSLGRIVMRYDYNLLSTQIHSAGMEAGERWMLNDVAGQPIRSWNSRGHMFRTEYDALHRPVRSFVQGSDPENPAGEILFGRTEYGEGLTNDTTRNLRTRAFCVFDSAGIVTSDEYDFKGNLLRGNRQFVTNYRTRPDWSDNPALDPEMFASHTTYDALNRPLTVITPDNSVVHPTYNEANFLERMEVNLRGSAIATEFIRDIDYDAKGQRELIEYGNGVRTTYQYDPLTFRLTRLHTQRGTDALQDLSYTYDPTGNITDIRDDAQQTIYFNNQVVEPHVEYTYDAIYRLRVATGREHIGQATQPQTTWNDEFRSHLPHPHDGQAMRRYTEEYEYDGVGNFLRLIHQATNGNWTRTYTYEEASLIEPGKQSNRLSRTNVGGTNEPYRHDIHGNMTSMPHLSLMQWDFQDQLQASARQVVNAGTPETTWYVYDGAGQRVRKVTERSADVDETPTRTHERIYLGGFEVYREYDGSGDNATLERQTLHVMDDKQRVAMVETRTQGEDGLPAQSIRYQLGNHLGSASLELDSDGAIISYEEYHSYGSTAYQAGRSVVEVSLKRYRYTGMERDEETGLNYHGARYYAGWLGRWVAADPMELSAGINRFQYGSNNPVSRIDPAGTIDFPFEVPSLEDIQNAASETASGIVETAQEIADDPVGAYGDYLDATVGASLRYVGEGLAANVGDVILAAEQTYVDVKTKGLTQTAVESAQAAIEGVKQDVVNVIEGGVGTVNAVAQGELSAAAAEYWKAAKGAWSLAATFTPSPSGAAKLARTRKLAARAERTAALESKGAKSLSSKPAPAKSTPAPSNQKALPPARTAKEYRNAPGTAWNAGKLPESKGRWLRGKAQPATGKDSMGVTAKIPRRIGEQLAGKRFKNFGEFRATFWKLIADDPALSKGFNAGDLALMRQGRAPYAPKSQQLGGRVKYELHHISPIESSGRVYELNNIQIVTPRYHEGSHRR